MNTTDNNIFLTLIFVFWLVGIILGNQMGIKSEQRKAIKSEVAHYVADESGNSKFEYIKK